MAMSDGKKYPDVITPENLASYKSIEDDKIALDISETEREVVALTRLEAAERECAECQLILQNTNEARLISFKADARHAQRDERMEFVAFLKKLQAARLAEASAKV
jgi:hypothetical protein